MPPTRKGMNYQQTLDYLYSRLPMFSRLGAAAIKKDLTNTLDLCDALGNPQRSFRSVHVAGTNGKGSVSHMLAAILQTAGYKTGLYTSPHLKDFRERIRINGEMISEEEVIGFTETCKEKIESIEPSFFEVTVAMAFSHFAEHQADIAIIETGLGGRLDSTNIITPVLSVITNIGYDHMNILGNTLPEIAAEKAGIIKAGIPVVIGEHLPETVNVFLEKAAKEGSRVIFASEEWQVEDQYIIRKDTADQQLRPIRILGLSEGHEKHAELLDLDLTGSYQLKNIKTVWTAVSELKKQGFQITDEHLKTALKQVKSLTGLMGRWHILSASPLVICDTGHNEDGIREVLKNIQATSFENLHMVIGMVKDKDITKVLSLLPKEASYYFCAPDIERAKPAAELAAEAKLAGLDGTPYDSVKLALEAAKNKAGKDDLIFAGGSTFVVAEIV